MLLLPILIAASPVFTFDVDGGQGLTVSVDGIPIVLGSGFQVYAPGWTKSYFGSSWEGTKIERPDADTVELSFSSPSTAGGTLVYHREGQTLHVDQTYNWGSADPAEAEVTGAYLSASALENGTLDNGSGPKSLSSIPDAKTDMMGRRMAPDASTLQFAAPWGTLKIKPRGGAWYMFDARGYSAPYAMGRSIFWFGILDQPLNSHEPVHVAYDLTVDFTAGDGGAPERIAGSAQPLASAESALDDRLPLIPYPKNHQLTSEGLELGGRYTFPAGLFFHWDEFLKGISNRFETPSPKGRPALKVDGGVHDMKLPHQAFRIIVRRDGFTVFGQDEEGLEYGLRRLAMLAYSKGGHLYLPLGSLTDWPVTQWRGFHLSVGPKSPPFIKSLLDRVALPLGFNHAVVECEDAAWKTLPKLRGDDVLSLSALRDLFRLFKSDGIDAIPLVQSFGHAQYLFRGGDNLDVAYNPDVPYGVDPRKPRSKELLDALWDEIVETTEPNTIHFGCDEVDMTGWKSDPGLMTRLWQLQMPVLGDIAKKHGVSMMIWGDMGLGPGEAPDATNAPDDLAAAARRDAIPEGAIVCDWHYKADTNMTDFLRSLATWQSADHPAIAATWHDPDNICGFTAAAAQQAMGVLQTTWAGGHARAGAALTAFDDYAAYVLSAEYAWTGRQDPPADLGYDYRDVFRRLYFAHPMPLVPKPGTGVATGQGAAFNVGRYHFAPFLPLDLYSAVVPGRANAPKSLTIDCPFKATTIALACSESVNAVRGTPVVLVTVHLADGTSLERTLKYDEDVTALHDPDGIAPLAESSQTAEGVLSAAVIRLPTRSSVTSVDVKELDGVGGFTLRGITGF